MAIDFVKLIIRLDSLKGIPERGALNRLDQENPL